MPFTGNFPIGPVTTFGSGALPLVGAAGGILNGITQMFTNAANRRFQEHMYDRQRSDALADWNMQNQYNAPGEQMARLKAAGLNPNLVYGNGNAVATSGGMPRGASPTGVSGTAPRFDISGMYPMLMFQLREKMQEQQIENLKTQNIVLQTQASRNVAGTENIQVDTERKKFDLAMVNSLRNITLAVAQGNLDRLDIGNTIALQSNERAAAMTSANLQIAAQNVIRLRLENEMNPLRRQVLQAQLQSIQASNEFKTLTNALANKGFSWSDPYWIRVGSTILDKVLDSGDLDLSPVVSPVSPYKPRDSTNRFGSGYNPNFKY